jgi:hypothetical protein
VQTNYWDSKYRKSELQFSYSPDIGISKKNPTGVFGIKNVIGIPLTMGVPEMGTKNRNSQPRRRTAGPNIGHGEDTSAVEKEARRKGFCTMY